ncbi:MAG: hypothetical protein E5W53_28300, partial [Mesorhizobium sp.]
NWATVHDAETTENAFGIHLTDLPVADVPSGNTIVFTFFWSDAGCWEKVDFSIGIDKLDEHDPEKWEPVFGKDHVQI